MRFLRTHWWLLTVVAIASFTMLWRLDAQPIVNFDEGIHGEVSWEMVERGDWLSLSYTNGPYFRKPPVKIWMTAGLFKVFPIKTPPPTPPQDEGERNTFFAWALRLPSAVAGILTIVLTAWWAWEWTRSRWAAVLAGVILVTSPAIFEHAFRTGEMDGVLTFFVTAALYCWWKVNKNAEASVKVVIASPRSNLTRCNILEGVRLPRRGLLAMTTQDGTRSSFIIHHSSFWLLLCGTATGLAVMTKSAAGLLPLPIIALDYLLHRRWRTIPLRAFWFFVLSFSVLVVPWHAAMSLLHGTAFWNEYLGFHVVRRITEQLHNVGAGPLWYFGALRHIFAPWVWWLIAALVFEFILSGARAKRRISHNGTNTPKSTAPRMGEILRHFVPQDKLIPQDKLLRLLLIWLSATFVGFSATQTKFAWYILPLLPAAAMLIAWFAGTIAQRWRTLPVRALIIGTLAATIALAGIRTIGRIAQTYNPTPWPKITATLHDARADGLVAYGFAWQEQPAGYFMLRTSLPQIKLADGLTNAARADAKLAERDRAWLITKTTELPEELRATVGVPHQIDGWSLWPRVAPR